MAPEAPMLPRLETQVLLRFGCDEKVLSHPIAFKGRSATLGAFLDVYPPESPFRAHTVRILETFIDPASTDEIRETARQIIQDSLQQHVGLLVLLGQQSSPS